MKNDWEIKKLGEISTIISGQSPEGCFYNHSGEGLPFYQGKKEFTDKLLSEPTVWTKVSTKIAEQGDVLMSVRAPVGPVNFATRKICIGRGLAAIRVSKQLDRDFLFCFLRFNETEISGRSGAVFPSINKGQISEIKIPLPPLSEQQRIIKILDEAFEAIEKAKANVERNLKQTDRVLESVLHDTFIGVIDGGSRVTLGAVAKIMGGKRVPKGAKLQSEPTGHPYIRVADFNDHGSVDLFDLKFINDSIFETIKRYTISPRDLYVSIAGTIGKTGIVPEELDGANLTENACKLVFGSNVFNRYVYYFTKSRDFLEQAGLNTRVTAMPKLALSRLATVSFYLPDSLEEQRTIVARLDALSAETKKLEAIYQRKLACLEELKKSLLQKAFAGEL